MTNENTAPIRDALRVLYDLHYAPITFDFTTYLVLCECVRQLEGFKVLDVTIKANQFRKLSDKDFSVGQSEKEWRLKSITVDSCDLLPTVANLRLLRDTAPTSGDAYHLPPNYQAITKGDARYTYALKDLLPLHKLGANVRSLKAPDHAKHLIQSVLGNGYITLTLRNSSHSTLRNIDLEEWYKFYCFLTQKGHEVFVIPDFEDMFTNRAYRNYDWQIFLAASLDQRIRLALYESALMNFSPSGGNSAMVVYSNAPYAIFDFINGVFDLEKLTTQALGLSIGESSPWALDSQKFYWEKSMFDYLIFAFEEMIG
ncbi:MAG: hypothetical protein RIF37_03985 [Rhodospirillaceae bacterium]